MSLPIRPLRLPDAPEAYDREYMNNLLNALEAYMRELNAVGPVRAATVNISELPTSDTGLRAGDLWNNLGVVNVKE